jgi:hypothetical protein
MAGRIAKLYREQGKEAAGRTISSQIRPGLTGREDERDNKRAWYPRQTRDN